MERWKSVLGVLFCVAVVGGGGYAHFSRQIQRKQHAATSDAKLTQLIAKYNAVRDWNSCFDDEGYKVASGHRAIYTVDIERHLLRGDGRPLFVVGYVFEVRNRGGEFLIGLQYDGYPDLSFLLRANEADVLSVLNQDTDSDDRFAVVAAITGVCRPQFETDFYLWDPDEGRDGVEIIVEPADQYLLSGECLELCYVGGSDG